MRDLRAQGGHFLLDAPAQCLHQRHFAGERIAPGLEQRRLLHQCLLDSLILLCSDFEVLREHQRPGERLFRFEAGQRGAFGIDAVTQAIAVGIHAHIPKCQDGISGIHVLAVAHQHGAHDASFEVLHRTPVEVDLDEGRRHHRHRQRREGHPGAERYDGAEDDPPAGAQQALGVPLAGERCVTGIRRKCSDVHDRVLPCYAFFPRAERRTFMQSQSVVQPGVPLVQDALPPTITCACRCLVFITSLAGPNCCTRPASSTRILSTWAIREGR